MVTKLTTSGAPNPLTWGIEISISVNTYCAVVTVLLARQLALTPMLHANMDINRHAPTFRADDWLWSCG